MEIVLPPEIEESVLERSRKEGRSPEALVMESLSRAFPGHATPGDPGEPSSLAELLGSWIGCLASDDGRAGRAGGFVAGLRAKREAGTL